MPFKFMSDSETPENGSVNLMVISQTDENFLKSDFVKNF